MKAIWNEWGQLGMVILAIIILLLFGAFYAEDYIPSDNSKVETEIYTQGSLKVTRIYDKEKDNTCYILTDAFSLGEKYEEFYCVP